MYLAPWLEWPARDVSLGIADYGEIKGVRTTRARRIDAIGLDSANPKDTVKTYQIAYCVWACKREVSHVPACKAHGLSVFYCLTYERKDNVNI